MSSLSNLPYGKILDYWYEKLSKSPYRKRFLLTKLIEIATFKSHSGKRKGSSTYATFPLSLKNNVPLNPRVSIIIPAFLKSNKDKQDLVNLLASIERQTQKPKDVYLIDDGSPIRCLLPSWINICRFDQNYGPAKARNMGKKLAVDNGADIVAFTDSDCILSPNWVETIIKNFIEHREFQILSGNTHSYDKSWYGIYHEINGTLNGRRMVGSDRLLYGTTANLAITKEVAKSIDFNENFPIAAGEDIEFCFQANSKGFAIKHISSMCVYHHYGYNGSFFKNLKRFRSQFKKYGKGEVVLLKEVPEYYAYFEQSEEISAEKSLNN